MNKVRTTININKTVVQEAKELDINISAAAERGIIDYIREMENIRRYPTNYDTNNDVISKRQSTIRSSNKNSQMDFLGYKPDLVECFA